MARLDEEILESKAYKAAAKVCGEDMAKEIVGRGVDQLKDLIALNSLELDSAKTKMQENSSFVSADETVKLMKKALAEATKPYKKAIDLAVFELNRRKAAK